MERYRPACRLQQVFRFATVFFLALMAVCTSAQTEASQLSTGTGLEISRPVRPWEFMDAVGVRAGLFGYENGTFEAWVYPLKVLRNFHLTFRVGGREILAESLARTVEIRPESCTIVYAGDAFQVRETWFVPLHELGAVVVVEVNSHVPVQIEAAFEPDMQLMWPAGLGGKYVSLDKDSSRFVFGEEQKRYFALVGSPGSTVVEEAYADNYSASRESSFLLGEVKGNGTKVVAIAASVKSREEAESTYARLVEDHAALRREAGENYREYLGRTVSIEVPDGQLKAAYDWSRISTVQGVVENPYLGTGLIAGYRTSGEGARPGFAWFFGRDALWTTLALDSVGDSSTVRTALDFLAKYQRDDGKVPHEISQSAGLVPWFKDYPYPWASADATPLFIIAVNDYVTASGDTAFLRAKWNNVWRAYEFLKSTYGPDGLAQNAGVGHGWVEGGPLLPVRTELYQAGLGVAAVRALANLATLSGKKDVASQLEREYADKKKRLNDTFWIAEKGTFAFALDEEGKVVDVPSVLATVPMWFGVLDESSARRVIDQLARPEHATDWGMRIISEKNPMFDPSGYHFGTVWPLFTGWAAVGEYTVHRANAGLANLRANSELALAGAPGRVTEVLSGSYFEGLSTSSPHQIWSSAMVLSSMLRGMIGLSVDATKGKVTVAPHVPADWDWLTVRNVRIGAATLTFEYRRTAEGIALDVRQDGPGKVEVEFSPSVSVRAKVLRASVNSNLAKIQEASTGTDKHVVLRFESQPGLTRVGISVRNDFGLTVPTDLPPLGGTSQNLKFVSEQWSEDGDTLQVDIAGLRGRVYDIVVMGGAQLETVEGGEPTPRSDGRHTLPVGFPGAEDGTYVERNLTLRFRKEIRGTRSRLRSREATAEFAGAEGALPTRR